MSSASGTVTANGEAVTATSNVRGDKLHNWTVHIWGTFSGVLTIQVGDRDGTASAYVDLETQNAPAVRNGQFTGGHSIKVIGGSWVSGTANVAIHIAD